MHIRFGTDIAEGRARLNRMQFNKIPAATARALTGTVRKVKTEAKRRLVDVSGMTSSNVGGYLKHEGASRTDLAARVYVVERRYPNLVRFGARMTKRGVSAKPMNNRRVYKGAFIVGMRNADAEEYKVVFVRFGKKVVPTKGAYVGKKIKRGPRAGQPILRQQLRPMWGPALRILFAKPEVRKPMIEVGREFFRVEFRRQMSLELGKQ